MCMFHTLVYVFQIYVNIYTHQKVSASIHIFVECVHTHTDATICHNGDAHTHTQMKILFLSMLNPYVYIQTQRSAKTATHTHTNTSTFSPEQVKTSIYIYIHVYESTCIYEIVYTDATICQKGDRLPRHSNGPFQWALSAALFCGIRHVYFMCVSGSAALLCGIRHVYFMCVSGLKYIYRGLHPNPNTLYHVVSTI